MVRPTETIATKAMPSFATKRKAVGRFVEKKIEKLQDDYTANTPAGSQAKAHLAILRHGFLDQRLGWLNVGYDLFEGWPTAELGVLVDEDNQVTTAAVKAVSIALQMYAIHQQSKSTGMAWFAEVGNQSGADMSEDQFGREITKERGAAYGACTHSFGYDCHVVDSILDKKVNHYCLKMLQRIEDMPSFTGIEHNLWSLIKLMRSHDVELDYNQFSQDLFDLQFPSVRSSVFSRWSRQYFGTSIDESDGGKQ
ncbi:type I-E CRISPR-associated protein Cse2/CasB [Bifidobacterium favimelis]|uniref:Type I-E CRISPR-associated protein Cse2/CasB n=1 Tax=Bifidobacterium favimelis TaxID=3122979 RepID=A0ABU8ZLM3_9BIFI